MASLAAVLLNRPRLLQLLLQYVMPPFQKLADIAPYCLVVSHGDVREVMERDDDFLVGPQVGPAMVCGSFALGTDRLPPYRDDLAFLWETFYRRRPASRLPPGGTTLPPPPKFGPLLGSVTARVEAVISAAERRDGRLDLVQDLLRPVCSRVVQEHMGVGPPDDKWIEALWEVLASLALRIILPGSYNMDDTHDPVVADLLWANATLRLAIDEGIDAAITAASTGRSAPANVIAKMHDVLVAPSPGKRIADLDRERIIRNISGLAITGCHPIAKAAAQAVDVLLSNPPAFRGATAAATAGNEDLFWDFIEEALRFFPPFPLVVRACPRDTVIGVDSGLPRKVRAGQSVTVGLMPAMFDKTAVPFPYQFRTDRARGDSLVFGRGMHTCFGYQFARPVLVALLMPLFACGFARAPGRKGQLIFDSVVPKSLHIRLSPPGIGAAKC
jgi:cytochrome P450